MELYNAQKMSLSNNPKLKEVQEKMLRGESLSISDKMVAGRDHPIKEINGYQLKPDHCYRAINEKLFNIYKEKGFIVGTGEDDEYQERIEDGHTYNNNKGVDWYLGGVEPSYGEIVLECPADKEYFVPASDNGCGMSYDPTVRFLKSSGAKKPIPVSMITNVFDVSKLKEQQENLNKEEFMKIREMDRQRLAQLRHQQLSSVMSEEQNLSGGMSR